MYLHKKTAEFIIGLMNALKLDSVYLMGANDDIAPLLNAAGNA
jgi:hypothetical protein